MKTHFTNNPRKWLRIRLQSGLVLNLTNENRVVCIVRKIFSTFWHWLDVQFAVRILVFKSSAASLKSVIAGKNRLKRETLPLPSTSAKDSFYCICTVVYIACVLFVFITFVILTMATLRLGKRAAVFTSAFLSLKRGNFSWTVVKFNIWINFFTLSPSDHIVHSFGSYQFQITLHEQIQKNPLQIVIFLSSWASSRFLESALCICFTYNR